MATEPDASGGLGSLASDIRSILTGALHQVAAPALGKLLGIGDLTRTVTADGQVVYEAAPTKAPAPTEHARDLLSNPLVVAAGVAAVVALVVMIVKD